MKRLLLLAIAIISVMLLTACGRNGDNTPSDEDVVDTYETQDGEAYTDD